MEVVINKNIREKVCGERRNIITCNGKKTKRSPKYKLTHTQTQTDNHTHTAR